MVADNVKLKEWEILANIVLTAVVWTIFVHNACAGKQPTVIPGGRGITEQEVKPKHCDYCNREQGHLNFWQCGGCNVVYYCNKDCQKRHWGEHISVNDTLLTIKPGKSSKVNIEILNNSKHGIVLPRRSFLGRVELVQSVTPFEVQLKKKSNNVEATAPEPNPKSFSALPKHVRQIDLAGLSGEQKQLALKLLSVESESFSKDDDDIGSVPDLKLGINLTDKVPVQKNYVAVPRPLYPEVKTYIEDLLNRNLTRKSNSSYSCRGLR